MFQCFNGSHGTSEVAKYMKNLKGCTKYQTRIKLQFNSVTKTIQHQYIKICTKQKEILDENLSSSEISKAEI